MNKQLLILALSAALGITSAQAADQAADTGFYVGGSLGQSTANDFSGSDVDADLATLGLTSSSSTDDTDTAWKLFAGYRFMKYLAVEGAYTDLGKFTAHSIISPGPGIVDTEIEANAWTISALGILPLGDSFSLFGRVGVNFWSTDSSASGSGTGAIASASESDNGTDWVYGVGAAWNFTRNLSLRGEWERYDFGDSDADLWSAGLSWNF